jgi:hypothetical protein
MSETGTDMREEVREYIWGYPIGYTIPKPYTIMQAPHIGHRQHLCHLAERGEVSLEQMKTLVRDAKFVCKKCGRSAIKEENLCEPVPL